MITLFFNPNLVFTEVPGVRQTQGKISFGKFGNTCKCKFLKMTFTCHPAYSVIWWCEFRIVPATYRGEDQKTTLSKLPTSSTTSTTSTTTVTTTSTASASTSTTELSPSSTSPAPEETTVASTSSTSEATTTASGNFDWPYERMWRRHLVSSMNSVNRLFFFNLLF